jgi:acyl-CoA thioesterase I
MQKGLGKIRVLISCCLPVIIKFRRRRSQKVRNLMRIFYCKAYVDIICRNREICYDFLFWESEDLDIRPVIVAFGNSLTEGSGVDSAQNYPSKLQAKIDAAGFRYQVINAGIGGETTAQALNRIQEILDLHPAIVILEIGANDGLLGLPLESIRGNLLAIIDRLQSSRVRVILAGMKVPSDFGMKYSKDFCNIYQEIAKQRRLPIIPFLLEGVAGHAELNQNDGIHPTAGGYDVVSENVWKTLQPML